MNTLTINNLQIFERFEAKVVNESCFQEITNVASIHDANEHSLVFIDSKVKGKASLISQTKALTIICDPETDSTWQTCAKCFIVTESPKLLFAKVVNQLKADEMKLSFGVHPSTQVDPAAKISANCYIGPNCTIGLCEIGEGTIIHAGCHLYNGVRIGKNVIIDSGTVIGAAGFGFVRDQEGVPHRFPQLGGVVIEDDVEIGANSCIDRGALQDTIIHKGVKIDNLVQIAHNVEIGKYSYIIGHCAIAGSVKIGEKCWIAPSLIKNKLRIGDCVTVGFGAVVLKSIPSHTTVMGDPAMSIEKYSKLQYQLKKIHNHGN